MIDRPSSRDFARGRAFMEAIMAYDSAPDEHKRDEIATRHLRILNGNLPRHAKESFGKNGRTRAAARAFTFPNLI